MQKTSESGVPLNRYAINLILKVALVGLILVLGVTASIADELPAIVKEGVNTSPNSHNLWISAGMLSYHFNREARHRDLNWGYGIQSNLSDDVSVLGGNFINSKYVRSNYLGMAWQPLKWHSVKIGLEVGVIDGYPDIRHGDYFVAVMPCLSIHNDLIGVNLTLVPYYSNNMHSSAISAQMIMRVW